MNIWRKCLFIKKNKKTEKLLYEIAECDRVEKPKEPDKFKNYDDPGGISIFAAAFLVILMVTTIVYSLYTFMHASGLSDLAGVHVTASIKSAADEIIHGKAEIIPGYENWLIYRGGAFEFKYPSNWTFQGPSKERKSISLKKHNGAARSGFDSVEATIVVQFIENVSMQDVLKKEGAVWNGVGQEKMIGGKTGIRTGEVGTDLGVLKDFVFWRVDEGIYMLKIEYLSTNIDDSRNVFEKIIAQFKFN